MKKTTFALLMALTSPSVLAAPEGGFRPDKAPPPPQKQDSGIRGMEDLPPTLIKNDPDRESSPAIRQGQL